MSPEPVRFNHGEMRLSQQLRELGTNRDWDEELEQAQAQAAERFWPQTEVEALEDIMGDLRSEAEAER